MLGPKNVKFFSYADGIKGVQFGILWLIRSLLGDMSFYDMSFYDKVRSIRPNSSSMLLFRFLLLDPFRIAMPDS